MAVDFPAELARLKKPVWKVLQSYLPDRYPEDHYKMVKDYPARQGKYLRPGLLLLSTKMLGGSQENALLLAAAMQASEDWLLVHDDVEDHSQYRRSTPTEPRPTLHQLYGEEFAINAGDALHILMWQILGDAVERIGGTLGWKIFRKMNDILLTTTEGQFLDLAWIRNNIVKVTPQEYYRMVSAKTVYYSIVGPLQLGAMAAGHSSGKIMAGLKNWGTPLGYAFQIRDDLINLTQASDILGKEQGGDILEGKRTLMLIHLLENCTASESDHISAIYRKPRSEKTEIEKNYVMQLMERYGSFDYATGKIKEFCKQAEGLFRKQTKDIPRTPAKDYLQEAIHFVGKRQF